MLKKYSLLLPILSFFDMIAIKGNQSEAARPSSSGSEGIKIPPDERKEGDSMYITFADLIQFCLLLVALISLCYQIFKEKRK